MNLLHHSSSHIRRRHHHHLQVRSLCDAVTTLKCPRDRGLDHAVERERHLKPLLNLKTLIVSEPSKSIPLALITQSNETLGIPFGPIEFIQKYPSIFQEYWGLPRNYAKIIIPEFPDYFRVINENKFGENGKRLELVYWTDEFAVSEMKKKGGKDEKTPFLMQYSKEFEMDKEYKKWVDEWQKLPYISPYENAAHLAAKTDESNKWAVAVLNELLNLFVGKKVERDSLLYLGERLGLRSRFKLAFLQHAGIFYVSSKMRTHTVVLKEGYKRGMLIERHSLNDMRFKYVQLMNVEMVEEKTKNTKKETKKKGSEGKECEEEDDAGNELDDDDEMHNSSDDENEEDDEGFEGENGSKRGGVNKKGENLKRGESFEEKGSRRNVGRRTNGRMFEKKNYGLRFEGENVTSRGRFRGKGESFEESDSRRSVSRTNGRTYEKINYGNEANEYKSSTKFSKRTNVRNGDQNVTRLRTRNPISPEIRLGFNTIEASDVIKSRLLERFFLPYRL
ncbi:hypothetical protein CASFOL_016658 [Castilleja foliolosa]|uniref:PORR domain-containing protein n=1 Tax=Castilleja foliolosa TaxID=1961234 RepID=A0ABD3D8V8_9LAMI